MRAHAISGHDTPTDELLRASLETAPGGMLLVDGAGRVAFVNRMFRDMWGLSDGDIPDDADALLARLDGFLAEDLSQNLAGMAAAGPGTVEHSDGRWIIVRTWLVRDGDPDAGRFWQFHEVIDDLRVSEARLRDFADVASDYFWETGADDRFTFISDRYRQVTGVRRAEVLGLTRAEIWTAHGQPDSERNKEYAARVEAAVEGRETFSDVRVEWRRGDGRDLIISISGKPVFDTDGTYAGYRGVGTVVTDLVRQEEALRDSEQRLRNLLEASPIGVSVVSKETNVRLFVNKAFSDMMAAAPDELIGGKARDAWADAVDRDPMMRLLERAEQVVDFESRRRRLDGSEFWALMNFRDVDFAGTPARMYWIMDITARRETERILRESELRFREILEDSPIAFSVVSEKTGKRQFVNRAYVEMMHAGSAEALLSGALEDSWGDPEDMARLSRQIDGGEDLVNAEAWRKRLDGEVFPAAMSSREIEFGGEPARVYWMIDLTERLKAEQATRQSEERLRAILETSPLAFIVSSPKSGKRIFVNRAAVDMFGASSPEHLLETEIIESWVDKAAFARSREIIEAGGELHNFETLRRRFDGTVFATLLNSRMIEFEGERALIIWITDITDRVNAENAVRENEAKLREILEDSPIGISVVSAHMQRRLFANSRMAELFGAENPAQIVAMEMQDSWPDLDEFNRTQEILATGLDLTNYEVRRKRVDGGEFWVLLNSQNIEFEGEQARVVWHHEITEIRRQQDQLKAAMESADMANRAKSEFLSSMSHELRTPLNSILGFAQIMQLDTKTPLTDRQENSVEQILRGGQHLLELIDQVLDLAKIEAGNLEFDFERMALGGLLDECRDMVHSTAEENRISVDIVRDIETDPLEVLVDRTALRQIILNLLSNAIKYNRAGGHVSVSRKLTAMGMLRLSVADTGIGISREYWDDVFEPFSRLGRESSEIEGTGIGLTLSQRLAEQMGGGIGFTSEPGAGSTFWIDLPLARDIAAETEDAAGADAADPGLAHGLRGSVLYVEDNLANMQLVKLIFDHLDGLDLIPATTAEIGLDLAASRMPNVILMDIRLPGIDGYEALRRLKADPATNAIPVIALSADAMPENIERGRAAGFEDYLTKPLDVAQVIGAINRAMVRAQEEH
ncbi:MAG: PAS domain S-box protein [Magnetovibrio sp.]|nr:PAS domain S-box protein [Magnetovibrio sp.]